MTRKQHKKLIDKYEIRYGTIYHNNNDGSVRVLQPILTSNIIHADFLLERNEFEGEHISYMYYYRRIRDKEIREGRRHTDNTN